LIFWPVLFFVLVPRPGSHFVQTGFDSIPSIDGKPSTGLKPDPSKPPWVGIIKTFHEV